MDSLAYNENINTDDLNKRVNRVDSYEEVMDIITKHEDIIETNKKKVIFVEYQQGKVFRKVK